MLLSGTWNLRVSSAESHSRERARRVPRASGVGSRYLLKPTPKIRWYAVRYGVDGELLLLLRGLLKKLVNGISGIASDDKPLLARSGLLLLGYLRFRFLGHCVLLLRSRRLSAVVVVVPPPGIGPGRPFRSRECKSRLSASSSTGGQVTPDVGTGGPSQRAVPTWFGSSSATPHLFSCVSLLSSARLDISPKHLNGRFEQTAMSFGEFRRISNF
jgi:hypothetical protein